MIRRGQDYGAAQFEENRPPFFQTGYDITDVFLPIMGPDCFAVYSVFRRRAYFNPKLRHTVDDLAAAISKGGTTVSRALQILEHLKLAQLIRRGGSQASECVLLDSWEAALRLGVRYDRQNNSYVLPDDVEVRLRGEIQAIAERHQGKHTLDAVKSGSSASSETRQRFSEKRQRPTRGTHLGTHLLRKEERSKEHPSPTPSHSGNADRDKNFPDEDEPLELVKCARNQFTGVIDEFRALLLGTDLPPISQLANGYEDWVRFGFGHLAIERASRFGPKLTLVISAPNPAETLEGLKKYRQRWYSSLAKWFGCEVECDLIKSPQDVREAARNGAEMGVGG